MAISQYILVYCIKSNLSRRKVMTEWYNIKYGGKHGPMICTQAESWVFRFLFSSDFNHIESNEIFLLL